MSFYVTRLEKISKLYSEEPVVIQNLSESNNIRKMADIYKRFHHPVYHLCFMTDKGVIYYMQVLFSLFFCFITIRFFHASQTFLHVVFIFDLMIMDSKQPIFFSCGCKKRQRFYPTKMCEYRTSFDLYQLYRSP